MSEETTETTSETGSEATASTTTGTSWIEQAGLDADLSANPSITKFKDVGSLAKSYLELQSTLGKERIPIPGKDAKPEEWDAVYNRLGRPETVAGYELDQWAAPEGLPWDMEVTNKVVERMHAHRLTKEQAQGVLNDYAEIMAEGWNGHLANIAQANEHTATELKSKWGAAYAAKMDAAKRAAVHYAGPSGENGNLFDTIVLEDGRKLGDHPAIIEIFSDIGERYFTEDGSPGPGRVRMTRTPEEAKKQLNEMIADPEKMKILTDAGHPLHKEFQALKTDLEKQAYNA